MSDSPNTYQPKWGEKKSHRHHHHYHRSDRHTNGWGGWLKMRDKQAYYGLMFVVFLVLAFGAYKLVMLFVNEIKAMPMDDPNSEMTVDELRVRKVEEQDAILYSDSLAKAENVDSIRRKVQIETTPVYRPPRRENQWYITQREWKSIWKNYKIWRWEKKREKEKKKESTRREENSSTDPK